MGGFSFSGLPSVGIDWTGVIDRGLDILTTAVSGSRGRAPTLSPGGGVFGPLGGILGQGSLQNQLPSELRGGGGGRRRMNVLNPKALRRSMRRVQGFAKFAKKTISFTRRVKMKKRTRR